MTTTESTISRADLYLLDTLFQGLESVRQGLAPLTGKFPQFEDPLANRGTQEPDWQSGFLTRLKSCEKSTELLSERNDFFAVLLAGLSASGELAEKESVLISCARAVGRTLEEQLAGIRELERIRVDRRIHVPRRHRRLAYHAADKTQRQIIRLLRIIVLYCPAAYDQLAPEVQASVFTFHIPWWAYLRSMWNLFWSATRHPLCETTIDLSTGRVLYRT